MHPSLKLLICIIISSTAVITQPVLTAAQSLDLSSGVHVLGPQTKEGFGKCPIVGICDPEPIPIFDICKLVSCLPFPKQNDVNFPSLNSTFDTDWKLDGTALEAPSIQQVAEADSPVMADESVSFPSVVALLDFDQKVVCTATLVSNELALTAAHCICSTPIYSVFFGTTVPTSPLAAGIPDPSRGLLLSVVSTDADKNFLYSPTFCEADDEERLSLTDVALVRFDNPFELPSSAFIPLADADLDIASDWSVVGFGATNGNALGGTKLLGLLQGKLCDESNVSTGCKAGMELVSINEDVKSTDTCGGDSGGPLIISGKVVGIVRRGVDTMGDGSWCGNGTIFTYILSNQLDPKIYDWIKSISALEVGK